MQQVKVCSSTCTLGAVGDVVDVPEGIAAAALIDAGLVEPVKAITKKAAAKNADDAEGGAA